MNTTSRIYVEDERSTQTAYSAYHRDLLAVFLGCLLMMLSLGASANTPEKVSNSEGTTNFPVASTNATANNKRTAIVANKIRVADSNVVSQGLLSPDYEIFDADVTLFYDDDRDGYFHGIEVNFDADTEYFVADVYARLYLSYEGRDWEHYYTTEVFSIFDNTSDDDYTVDTELYSGYPTGYYDVLIELYEADTGYLVAEFGPQDSTKTIDLPLEDQQKDAGFIGSTTIVTHSSGGGGALSLPALLVLLLVGLRRELNRQRK